MKKKQWLPGIIVIVVIIGIVAGMRISSHLRTFGLSKSVLQGEQTPDAEGPSVCAFTMSIAERPNWPTS